MGGPGHPGRGGESTQAKKTSHGAAVCGESRTHGDNGGDGKTQFGCASCPYPLMSQQVKDGLVCWFMSKQWWFSVGQLLLYLSLAQALSSSLTEVTFGISLNSPSLALVIGLLALPVWWILLFAAPISFIYRVGVELTLTGHRLNDLLLRRTRSIAFRREVRPHGHLQVCSRHLGPAGIGSMH
jgi:hypothetical protein